MEPTSLRGAVVWYGSWSLSSAASLEGVPIASLPRWGLRNKLARWQDAPVGRILQDYLYRSRKL